MYNEVVRGEVIGMAGFVAVAVVVAVAAAVFLVRRWGSQPFFRLVTVSRGV